MNLTVFGAGYVGLVTAAGLAHFGNHVLCVDVDARKIALLEQAQIPFFEPGLADLVATNTRAGRLRFTTDAAVGVKHGAVAMICVGTPSLANGAADVSAIKAVVESLVEHGTGAQLVVQRSTAPLGTAKDIEIWARMRAAELSKTCELEVVVNPEFLKQGEAVQDFLHPSRIVIGAASLHAAETLRDLYGPMNRHTDKFLVLDQASAELVKYASNAMLATRISFMNEMAQLAEHFGADIEQVRIGVGADPRIGSSYLYAGPGYGGSCLPKDVRALAHTGRAVKVPTPLLDAVDAVNTAQVREFCAKVMSYFESTEQDLSRLRLACWGLAFKADTDDLRESRAMLMVRELIANGVQFRAYDELAATRAAAELGELARHVTFCASALEALTGCDALIVMTDADQFKSVDLGAVKTTLRRPVIFDSRNMFSPRKMSTLGFDYLSVGRPAVIRGKHLQWAPSRF
jgi:UDPglucose 6-dehydrogenase